MWKKGRELAKSFKRELTVYRGVLAVVPALVYAALRLIPQELVAEHRANVLADAARNRTFSDAA
jgi:hypothetical protein